MRDLSLHLLDIVQNSIAANARNIVLNISAYESRDILKLKVADDGIGMDEDFLKKVTDPFSTTRTTRRVGLGIPLLDAAAQRSGGNLYIESKKGKGTVLTACFMISSIDRPPLGNIAEALTDIIKAFPDLEIELLLHSSKNEFVFKTSEVRRILGDVPINGYDVLCWLKEYIDEGVRITFGGVLDEVAC